MFLRLAQTRRTATYSAWYYDMLNDMNRNDAYDAAITDAGLARVEDRTARPCVAGDRAVCSAMAARRWRDKDAVSVATPPTRARRWCG